MTKWKRLKLSTSDEGVLLLELVPQDARPLFELIDRNREHLSQLGDMTASKYPNFESVLQSIINPIDPTKIRFGIWWEGELTGTINLTHQSAYTAEIGYWVGREFCGLGLATLATCTIIAYTKRLVNTDRVFANTDQKNLASQQVLLKSGMTEIRRNEAKVWFSVNTES